jgi:hypothetical protein
MVDIAIETGMMDILADHEKKIHAREDTKEATVTKRILASCVDTRSQDFIRFVLWWVSLEYSVIPPFTPGVSGSSKLFPPR